jgi:uncharacterized protein YegJ (DUF2314 family)
VLQPRKTLTHSDLPSRQCTEGVRYVPRGLERTTIRPSKGRVELLACLPTSRLNTLPSRVSILGMSQEPAECISRAEWLVKGLRRVTQNLAVLALGVCLAGLVSCGQKEPPATGADSTVPVATEDAEMNGAISNAQASLTNFIAAFQAPRTNQNYFLIKGKFNEGKTVEHIWVADLTFSGQAFKGVIANQPESIHSLQFKQPVAVPLPEVSDWMFVQDGKLMGAYTSRVLRNRMTEQQRHELDASLPYKYD